MKTAIVIAIIAAVIAATPDGTPQPEKRARVATSLALIAVAAVIAVGGERRVR